MIFYRFIPFVILLFSSFSCWSQDSNYVYRDSAIFYQDSVDAAAKLKEKEKEETAQVETDTEGITNYISDTILRNNQLSIEADSVRVLKNAKPLAYAKNLDSLLYQYQQELGKKVDADKDKISWIARFFLSPITKYFFLLLAGLFVAVILYKLFFADGFLQKSYTRVKVMALPEDEDLTGNADYEKLIAKAMSNRDYRLGIRYHYLQSLQKLSSKGAIQFARDKTNYEYLRELSGKKYKSAFASITLHYEYVWYGSFEIDEKIFNSMQQTFKQFNSGI